MANIEIKGLDEVLKTVSPERLKKSIENSLKSFARKAITDAKKNAPVDEGYLRSQIQADTSQISNLKIDILANAEYAPYIEFGTRKFAASYVGSLPSEWQDIAAQYKGPGKGDFQDLILSLIAWVRRKGLAGTYSVKTKKRLGSSEQKDTEDMQLAYVIAKKILTEGVKPHPYLYPAINQNIGLIQEYINKEYGRP